MAACFTVPPTSSLSRIYFRVSSLCRDPMPCCKYRSSEDGGRWFRRSLTRYLLVDKRRSAGATLWLCARATFRFASSQQRPSSQYNIHTNTKQSRCRQQTTPNVKRPEKRSTSSTKSPRFWYVSSITHPRGIQLMARKQNTHLDRQSLSYCVSLIENGVNPEALAVRNPRLRPLCLNVNY